MGALMSHSKSKGMALFQVLLITMVISILALQFTQTAKNQIIIAATIVDRVQAQVNLKNTESELLFALFTEVRTGQTSDENQLAQHWNFHGKPFTTDENVKVSMQDQNGLISLYKGRPQKLLESMINYLGVENVSASVASNSLIDWQDGDDLIRANGAEASYYGAPGMPTNMPLQTYSETQNIRGFTPELVEALAPYVTIRPQTYFNPMTAPKEILAIVVGADKANQIISLRETSSLSNSMFQQLSGIRQDEGINFSPSGLLKISLKSNVNDVILEKSIEILVQPLNLHPLIEYQVIN
ncbi:Type II secretory pathway component PulK-like protein [Shewanella sediminis HAW-EB3]|uniref:Type II secretion system protein K n=2 Tax=Shewanella sediminis TaxID=271097 RepID=A8FXQ5_SHESH|nr:Type II secretory pathway component PulK-like protein [Shewanella sediminis HAW-EB3]